MYPTHAKRLYIYIDIIIIYKDIEIDIYIYIDPRLIHEKIKKLILSHRDLGPCATSESMGPMRIRNCIVGEDRGVCPYVSCMVRKGMLSIWRFPIVMGVPRFIIQLFAWDYP